MEDSSVAGEGHTVATQLPPGVKLVVSEAEKVHDVDFEEKDQVRDDGKLELIVIVEVEALEKQTTLVETLVFGLD